MINEIKIKLLGEKILVRPNVKTITKAGIIIPETAQESPSTGTVIAVGNVMLDGFKELKEGDLIKFWSSAANPSNWIKLNNELVICMRCGDIIGLIDELPDLDKDLAIIPTLIN